MRSPPPHSFSGRESEEYWGSKVSNSSFSETCAFSSFCEVCRAGVSYLESFLRKTVLNRWSFYGTEPELCELRFEIFEVVRKFLKVSFTSMFICLTRRTQDPTRSAKNSRISIWKISTFVDFFESWRAPAT